MTPGTIIYLNGTSSAGKSSIALALQDILPTPYLHISLDCFTPMFPRRYVAVLPFDQAIPPLAHEGMIFQYETRDGKLHFENRLGEAARRFSTGFRQAIRAFSLAGNNLIVDDVLQEREWLAESVDILADLPVLFIGVRCPPEVIASREHERGDRLPGLAIWQHERMHAGTRYDLEVDTSLLTTIECAQRIASLVANPPRVRAFEVLQDAH
jgi:chloramphenicol 3-O phosphotransferase